MAAAAGVVVLSATVLLESGQAPPPRAQEPFRTGIDVVELDVTVLDRDRRPVPGLTASDFTVLVDGKPRPIVAFRAVDLPKPVAVTAPWIRDVAPDVATNTRASGRVIVILIDDGSFGQGDDTIDIRAVQKTREIARGVVNELGADDVAAIVFSENNHLAQNFTSDRRRLLNVIDRFVVFPGPGAAGDDLLGNQRGSCVCGVCSIAAIGRVSEALQSVPHQRKILMYISVGQVVRPEKGEAPEKFMTAFNRDLHCNHAKRDAMTAAFRQAQLAHVTVQAIDPKGLSVGQVGGDPTTNPTFLRTEFLRTMAETTGGRAVVNDNEMERAVPGVLAESSSYYLVGVDSGLPKPDGRFHPVQVRVDRPGVEVRTRHGYFAREANARTAAPAHGLEAAIGDALPKSDFPMQVSVLPVASIGGKPELAVVLAVTQPARAGSQRPRAEPVDVLVRAFNPESGGAVGSANQRVNIAWTTTGTAAGLYEVMSRLPLRPGRYELRLGVRTDDNRTASVYTYAEVPDFERDDLSLSGLALTATPAPRAAPKDAFTGLLPVIPTALRSFGRGDRVSGFLRLYQRGAGTAAAATITTRITDSDNQQIGDGIEHVGVMSFLKTRSYDYRFDLPVRELPRGEYLLTVDVAAGGRSAQRAVRFSVR